ncbi:MAG: hypothetical protein Q7S50_01710 [bacterium]|nr:hypothetical protein [bacterium]
MSETDKTELKPFHESIVDTIERAYAPAFETLAHLIKTTKIPKGHDAIVEAWQRRTKEVGLNSDLDVTASVKAQKKTAEEAAREKKMEAYAVGEKPPGLTDDGYFETPLGVRAHFIINERGDVLVVDKKTGLLVLDIADEEDD